MTATLLWSTFQNWQEPWPIQGNAAYTVQQRVDVPAISPSGTAVMFVVSNTYAITWEPNVAPPVTYYGYPFIMTPEDCQGGQFVLDKTFTPLGTYLTPPNVPPVWAIDTQNDPNTSIAIYIWDVQTVDFQGYPQGILTSFNAILTPSYITLFINPAAGQGAGPSPHEDVAYSFPAYTVDPAIDTAWTLAFPRLTPPPAPWPSGYQFSSLMLSGVTSIAPNDYQMYSTAQHWVVVGRGALSGSPAVTGGNTDSVQLPSYRPLNPPSGQFGDTVFLENNYVAVPWYGFYRRANPATGFRDPQTITIDSIVNFSLQSNSGHIHNYDANFSLQFYSLGFEYDPTWYNSAKPVFTPLGSPVQWTIPKIPGVPTSDPCAHSSWSIFGQGYATFIPNSSLPVGALSFSSTVTQRSSGIGNPPLYYNAQILFMDSGNNILDQSPIFQQYYGGSGINFYNYSAPIPSGTDHVDFHVWWEGFGPSSLWNVDAHVSWAIYCDVSFPPGTLQSRQLVSVQTPINPYNNQPYDTNLYYQIYVTAMDPDGTSPSNSFYMCKDVYSVTGYVEAGNDTRYLSELIPGHSLELLLWDSVTQQYFTANATVANVIDDTHAELAAPIPAADVSFGPYTWPTQAFTITFTNTNPTGDPDILPAPLEMPPGASHVYIDASVQGAGGSTTYLMLGKGYRTGSSPSYLGGGSVVYKFTAQPAPTTTQYISVFDNGRQGAGQGTEVQYGWWFNDLYPVHRILELNRFSFDSFTPAFLHGFVPPDGCQITLNITFMALVPAFSQAGASSWQPVAQSQDFQQGPTISGAPDTQYSWQDNNQVAYPGNFSVADATYTGGVLPATGGHLQGRDYPTQADIDGTVAVDYGPVEGVGGIYTYASVPGFLAIPQDLTIQITTSPVTSEFATFDGLIFRTLPQNNSCMFLGQATIHSGYTNTPYTYTYDYNTDQYVYTYTNALTPAPTAFDPALVIVKTVARDSLWGGGTAMSLAADGTVWISGTPDTQILATYNYGGLGAPWLTGSDAFFIRPSEWGFSSNDLPRPVTTALDGTPLPAMVDIDCNSDDEGGITWLMLDGQGNLWGMGYNFFGQLGVGASSMSDERYIDTDFFVRAPVVVANNVTTFCAGYNKSMMVSNGQLYVCGRSVYTTLGLAYNPPPYTIPTWTLVPGMTGVRQIVDLGVDFRDAGYVCLMADGSVWGWTGDAWNAGILGPTNYATYPRGTDPATGFAQWPPLYSGANGSWVPIPELGSGNREIQGSGAVQYVSPFSSSHIVVPALYTRTNTGQILITGNVDAYGSAGDGVTTTLTNTRTSPPFQVLMPTPAAPPIIDPVTGQQQIDPISGLPLFGPTPAPITAVKLAQARWGMAFIGSDGLIYTWGYNGQGQLGWVGSADSDPHPTPTAIPGLDQIIGLSATGVFCGAHTTVLFAGVIPTITAPVGGHVIIG